MRRTEVVTRWRWRCLRCGHRTRSYDWTRPAHWLAAPEVGCTREATHAWRREVLETREAR